MRLAFAVFFELMVLTIFGQPYFTNQFRSSDGLDTDIIKCVIQDDLGFMWMGTDDGLFRYDGSHFTRYPDGAPSKFFKDFIQTSDGRILAIHDLGITEIISELDSVKFREFLPGTRSLSDTTLWYPKEAYEDDYGNLWISEPQSVVLYRNNSWKRFHFDSECNTTSFVRSFIFYQISSEELLIISNTGLFFIYDYKNKTISKQEFKGSTEVTYVIRKINGEIYLGTETGLSKLHIGNNLEIEKINVNNLETPRAIRDILQLNNNNFLICSEKKNTSIIEIKDGKHYAKSVLQSDMHVNKCFRSEDGTIWLSSDKGLITMKEPIFHRNTLDDSNNYIEGLVANPTNDEILVLNKSSLYSYNKDFSKARRLFGDSKDYFLSGVFKDDYAVISSGFSLYKVQNDQLVSTLDLSQYGRYLFYMALDYQGEIWVSQEASIGVKKIDFENLSFVTYGKDKGLPYEGSSISADESGIYVGTSNPDHYLFYKPYDAEGFKDLSTGFPEPFRNGLTIEDVAVTNAGIWIGTNFGLFRQLPDKIEKIHISSSLDNSAIRMLQEDGENLWIATTSGLLRYDYQSGDYAHFTENSGLPANTVNHDCFIIDGNQIWVGTSQGIAHTNYEQNATFKQTKTPYLLRIEVNGKQEEINPIVSPVFDFSTYLDISYSSLTYPANDLQYSYRINENEWSTPSSSNKAVFNQLKEGDFVFEVRAKRMGNYKWSQVRKYAFSVKPPFYKTSYFIILVSMALGVSVIGTISITRSIEKRRQATLKKLVAEQTQELSLIKDNLEIAVKERTAELEETLDKLKDTQNHLIQAEKMASLGVLTAGIAHEINNPVNYLKGGLYSLDKLILETEKLKDDPDAMEQLQEVMGFMKLGMDRITHIVNGLGRYSRKSGDHTLPCNLHEILENSLLILEHEIKGKLEITKSLNASNFTIEGDEGTLHQLFVNIISNAIHATEEYGQLSIETYNLDNQSVVVKIQDTGSGISQADMDKVYDPFFTTKAPGIGTGLGLFIAKRIVNEHTGNIDFQSEIGVGTSVFITFKTIQQPKNNE